MDIAVVKTILSDFSTFVGSIVDLVKNVPAALHNLAVLVGTHDYNV